MSGGVSEYVDEDTARSIETGRQSIGVALRTAQEQLQKVFIAFVVGLLLAIVAMRSYVWPALKADLLAKNASVIAQTPFDVILLQVKIGLVVGVLFALPVLGYYARAPLAERDIVPDVEIARWKLALLTLVSLALAVGGSIYAYFLFFPIMFQFLAGNALSAGLAPMYSIVHWTEFILILAFSFAVAAQLPLVMSALSMSGIVPYETFRDKWKYAVVIIFTFGALFSPPDPFTQLMWALPLLILYGFSLYLARVLTVAYQGGGRIDPASEALARWNHIAGSAVLAGGVTYAVLSAGGVRFVNETVLPALPSKVRPSPLPDAGAALGMARPTAVIVLAVAVGLAAAIVATLAVLYLAIVRSEGESEDTPGPDEFDLSRLSLKGVKAAPPSLFEDLTEAEAVAAAREAMDADDPRKAQAILDRFERPKQTYEANPDVEDEERSDPFASTTAGMVNAFTEEETTEEDIGGYWYDIRFIVDSLRSRAFRLAGIFMVTMAAIFTFLYQGGIGLLREDFLDRIPGDVVPQNPDWPITLHPVEALVFEVKISTVLAAIVTVPFVFYYAYPALEERGIIGGDRRYITVWGISIALGLIGGSVLGYQYVAPSIISYLVWDAIQAGMIISYRVNNFFWMVFLTTAGIGLLADVPVSMVLFHRGGLVPYRVMRKRWRVAVLSAFVLGAVLTPGSLYTMFLVALPLSFAYIVGLGLLWVVTLGGRRGGTKASKQPA
ncbi:MAG: Sec-independent protein translocase TatC [Halanaeroarchaeum sp.]